MSPRIKVYNAKDIKKCKGYLDSVVPNDFEIDEMPTSTVTIRVEKLK